MKLLMGKLLIETDHIQTIEKLTAHTVGIIFVSGHKVEVVCGIKTTNAAVWDQDANGFLQTILNTDGIDTPAGKAKKK